MSDSTFLIKNDRLAVEIAQPGTIYSGTRFDWTGFVTQVTLDGKHTFCMPESLVEGQGTGGIGLCNEFGNDLPIGFDDAQKGETFPKLGIGLLWRGEEPKYDFFRRYQIANNFPIQVDINDTQADFIVEPTETLGYSARLEKTLKVRDNWLEFTYLLKNTGLKPFKTTEYAHNFMAIDAHPIGPDYQFTFPFRVEFEDLSPMLRGFAPKWMRFLPRMIVNRAVNQRIAQMREIFRVDGNVLGLTQIPSSPLYSRLISFSKTDQPQFELIHKPSGVWMREYDDFEPVRVAVWGVAHVISAEIFNLIQLEPGQSMSWKRSYEFGVN